MGKRHSVIVGMTRSGKTYFTKHVLKNLQSQGYHTVFFDPKHDDDYADLGEVCTTPVEFYAKLLKKVPRIVYRPSPKKDERADELSRIIEMMFSLGKKPGFKRMRRIVAIDEIQLMVKKGTNDGVEMLWTIGQAWESLALQSPNVFNYSTKHAGRSLKTRFCSKQTTDPNTYVAEISTTTPTREISFWIQKTDTTTTLQQETVNGK